MTAPNDNKRFLGLLNLNKPSGMTSRQAVDRVERLVRPAKAGHAGTLDPLASGVLVVCIGQATRLIEFVQQMPKRYRATFLLGRTSHTEDIEGEIVELDNPHVPTREEIERAAESFVGTIQQRPPVFSALKVAGKRAYELARKGKAVELKARPVTIHSLEVVEYRYPELVLDLRCSAGTYVRSLGRDLAESLGTGAVMSALVRTAVGPFRVEEAVDARQLNAQTVRASLQPAQRALPDAPQLRLTDAELSLLEGGQFLDRTEAVRHPVGQLYVALDSSEKMVALLKRRNDGLLQPVVNFIGRS